MRNDNECSQVLVTGGAGLARPAGEIDLCEPDPAKGAEFREDMGLMDPALDAVQAVTRRRAGA